MPKVWSYIVKIFFKIFTLYFLSCILFGLLMRSKKYTALFSLSASPWDSILLISYYLSFLIPIIIAMATLVAAFLTSYHFSSSKEITALRTSGMSFTQILMPLYFWGIVLSLSNFFIISEIVPKARVEANTLLYKSHINPLILLRTNKIPFMKNAHVEMQVRQSGKAATDTLMIFNTEKGKPLTLIAADELNYLRTNELVASNLSIITTLPKGTETFPDILLDQQKSVKFPLSSFSHLLKKRRDIKEHSACGLKTIIDSQNPDLRMEIPRRLSYALLTFSSMFLGLSFGLFVARRPKAKQFLLLATLVLFAFFSHFYVCRAPFDIINTIEFLLLSHALLLFFGIRHQNQMMRGVC